MFSVANHVRQNFKGALVISDVHGDYCSFKFAQDYALKEGLFLLSLGDLVDRARQPFEVVSAMYNLIIKGLAGFTIGNHDDKYYRAYLGNKVIFSSDAKQTLDDVGQDRLGEFYKMYAGIIEHKTLSGIYHKFDNFTIVHAACHPCMWNNEKFGKSERWRCLIGEVSGETYEDGYPIRLYNWVEDVPKDNVVIVGHDKQPINNIFITEPMQVTNLCGGKVIFLDTGCGKCGFLSGVVILNSENGFIIDKFMEFK